MKTQTLCVLYLFISLSSSQRIQDLEPVPVILTGDSQCEHCPNKVSYNCKISNKIIWGVQLARKSTAKNTKPVFGQHTKTSINLDSLGYLITLFIVGKNLTSSQNNLFYRYLHRFISSYLTISHNWLLRLKTKPFQFSPFLGLHDYRWR